MAKKEFKNLKEELNEAFTDEYIKNAGIYVHRLAENFYKQNELEGKVYFNDDIFQRCLIDILVDIARLKSFHDIENVNIVKLLAYTTSWCLKRKPFQMIEGCEEKYIFINERFALSLLLHAVGYYDEDKKYAEKDEKELIKAIQHISYHLQYRNTNPQTLELFIIGLESGNKIYATN